MKLKYYLRGLGIGIAVTAVVMGVSAKAETVPMTDQQIIERAKTLGMVEGVLANLSEGDDKSASAPEDESEAALTPDKKDGSASAPEKSSEQTSGKTKDDAQDAAPGKSSEQTSGKTMDDAQDAASDKHGEQTAAENNKAAAVDEGKLAGSQPEGDDDKAPLVEQESFVVVAIYPGEGSYTVSRKLAALGLVESADIYDQFLCQNGYDKRLTTGNHEIKVGMTAEEIAKALTTR